MAAKPISISSQSHLDRTLNTNSYVVVDFWADWCGPCKAIAPVFEQLASTESKPGRLAFAKVNVDSESSVAKKYGVSAMPTFLVLRKDTVVKTIRGANPGALRAAVSEIARLAATSTFSSSGGHVLGSSSQSTTKSTTSQQPFSTEGFLASIVRFFMLYITTLLSLDPMASAQYSPYKKQRS